MLKAILLASLTFDGAAVAQSTSVSGSANFRPLVDSSITIADVAMDDQGAITVFTKTNIYRWSNGALTELFPNAPISQSLTGATTQILRGTPYDAGSVDLILGDYSGYSAAVARKTADGLTMLSKGGDQSSGPRPFTLDRFSGLVRAWGKTAFWAAGNDVSLNAIKVYDGSTLAEWFSNQSPIWWEQFDTMYPASTSYGGNWFDGETTAFVALSYLSGAENSAVLTVNATGELTTIARKGDPIPGTTNTFVRIRPDHIIARNGRVLFQNGDLNGKPLDLVEHDSLRIVPLRRIASVGDITEEGEPITELGERFDVLSDGSVIFEAFTGNSVEVYPNIAILRSRDGRITTDLDHNRNYNSRPLTPLQIVATGGTNYVFTAENKYYTTADASEAPVQLEKSPGDRQWGNTSVTVLGGIQIELTAPLLHGSNVKFQWFREYHTGGATSTNVAIANETNQTLRLGLSHPRHYGTFVLVASNAISSDWRRFHLNVWEPWGPMGGFRSWEGLEGDPYELDGPGSDYHTQWFKDGTPIPEPPLKGVLSPQTVGTYWFTSSVDWVAGQFTSTKMTLRIAPVREVGEKFRRVGFHDGIMKIDGSITYSDGDAYYRWFKGVSQKLFDAPKSIPDFPDARIYATIYGISSDNTFCDIAVRSKTNWQHTEIYRLNTNGFRLIARPGLEIESTPPVAANRLSDIAHAGGKTAFWAMHYDTNFSPVATALKVYDGSEIHEWINTHRNWPSEFSDYEPWLSLEWGAPLGFDGVTAAFVGGDPVGRSAIFTVNAAGEIRRLAKYGDPIPGTTNLFGAFNQHRIVVQDGKILFTVKTIENFQSRCLVEFDPSRAEPLRVIAREGDMVDDLPIHWIVEGMNFGYTSDGCILFNAGLGYFNLEMPLDPSFTNQFRQSIIRWRDGKLTAEVTARDRFGGEQNTWVNFGSVAGTNYCFSAGGSVWTTAEGAPRQVDPTLQATATEQGIIANWTGDAILQWSPDFVRWRASSWSPLTVTNDYSQPARFFRVFYP